MEIDCPLFICLILSMITFFSALGWLLVILEAILDDMTCFREKAEREPGIIVKHGELWQLHICQHIGISLHVCIHSVIISAVKCLLLSIVLEKQDIK